MKTPQKIRAVVIIFLAVCLFGNSGVTAQSSRAGSGDKPLYVVVCGTPSEQAEVPRRHHNGIYGLYDG